VLGFHRDEVLALGLVELGRTLERQIDRFGGTRGPDDVLRIAVDERRDLRADFRQAFPREATAGLPRVAALAFATDTDNTKERATAYYGDIQFAQVGK